LTNLPAGRRPSLQDALERAGHREPFAEGDLATLRGCALPPRLAVLSVTGLWSKVPPDEWESWLAEYRADRDDALPNPFPPEELWSCEAIAERNGILSAAMRVPRNTLSVWLFRHDSGCVNCTTFATCSTAHERGPDMTHTWRDLPDHGTQPVRPGSLRGSARRPPLDAPPRTRQRRAEPWDDWLTATLANKLRDSLRPGVPDPDRQVVRQQVSDRMEKAAKDSVGLRSSCFTTLSSPSSAVVTRVPGP
jgi:hypothetical protein